MTVLIGNVYYADDPERLIFRRIWPTSDNSELDDPQWVTIGCDPSRQAVLIKVPADSPEATAPMIGLP